MRRQIALRIRYGKCIYFKRHIDEPFLNTIFTIDQNGANAHTHTHATYAEVEELIYFFHYCLELVVWLLC